MTARILSGTAVADTLLRELAERVRACDPHLAIVQVGDDPASDVYVQRKLEACKSVGMRALHRRLPASVEPQALSSCVAELNADPDISGILLQLPLPAALEPHAQAVLALINPAKDVDGCTAANLGNVLLGGEHDHLPPATPAGVVLLLEHAGIALEGLRAVVVGRSNLVGKPLALMLLNRGATVTVCHSKTRGLAAITAQADLLVSAVGKEGLITAEMVKEGAVVVDIGITRGPGGIAGDVCFEAVSRKASAVTPVPGGVGPMTVAMLIRNCVAAKERQAARGHGRS